MSGCGIFKSDIFWVENFEKVDFLKSVGNCFGGVGKVFGGPEMGFGGAGKVFGALYESEMKQNLAPGSPPGSQNPILNFS